MTQYLPPNLLALFAPRDPVPYMPPNQKLPHEKKLPAYNGVSQFLNEFEDPKDTPPPTRVETRDEKKERKRKERAEQVAYKLEQDLAMWDPKSDGNCTTHAFKTMFIGRINFDTSESKLRREFEAYGPVRRIRMIHDVKNGLPRGYAFCEFEHEADMHSAYKHADGKKIDGRRVLVDIERGRTIDGWRPRRLGGGLGGTRRGGPEVNTKFSGRDDGFGAGREERSRSRDKERERPRRRRSRSRERERPRRERSRDRGERRRRSRSKSKERRKDEPDEERKRRRRSRSRERRRSRSRDRDRKRRRSRSKERRASRERRPGEGEPEAENGDRYQEDGFGMLAPEEIKEEPADKGVYGPPTAVPATPARPENGDQEEYEYNEYGSFQQE